MGNMKCIKGTTVILVPYPAQGHVTPIFKLASTLSNQGFDPVIIIPEFIHKQIIPLTLSSDIRFVLIPDGLENGRARDFFAIEKAMEQDMPVHLERLVREEFEGLVACFVVDLLASWAVEVGGRCGVPVAGFWTAMFSTYKLIAAIPDMVRTGLISDTGIPEREGPICFLPNEPVISTDDLPWLIGNPTSRKARFKFWTRTLERTRNLPWLLTNSFPNESISIDDDKVLPRRKVSLVAQAPRVFRVGPLNTLAVLKNPSFWEEDETCLNWLDKQETNTVIYISFGSWISPIGESKVKTLAMTLEEIGQPFIWVLGHNWREGLPKGYIERVSKQGKIVCWAPQVEILQHKAISCYLTHCGWNSTMEAIQCKKRLLCYPVAGDQFVNCAYIVQKWRIGVRINGFGIKDVEDGLRKVMEDANMRIKLSKLHELTMGEEACSLVMSNLKGFIDDLRNKLAILESLNGF